MSSVSSGKSVGAKRATEGALSFGGATASGAACQLAREASPEMMRELIDLAKTAEDERVSEVAPFSWSVGELG
jgi:hypothetical protein